MDIETCVPVAVVFFSGFSLFLLGIAFGAVILGGRK